MLREEKKGLKDAELDIKTLHVRRNEARREMREVRRGRRAAGRKMREQLWPRNK